MRLTITKSELQATLAAAARIAAGAKTQELACVMLDASDALTVEATDMERALRVEAAALVEDPGAALVPARRLLDIVKTLPDEAVEVCVSQDSASVKCGKSTFRIPSLSPSAFPGFPEVEPDQTLTLPHFVLAGMAKTVMPFASKPDACSEHPILAGVLVEHAGGTLRMVATDTYHMAVCEVEAEGGDFSTVVPAAFLAEAVSAEFEGAAAVTASERQVKIEFGGTVMTSRLLEGRYPGWSRLVPSTISSRAVFAKRDILSALRMCSAGCGGKSPVTLAFDGGTSTFSCAGEDGSMSSHVDCECDGAGEFKCSIKLLEDACKACGSDDVEIGLGGTMKPVLVTGGTCKCIVMPMR